MPVKQVYLDTILLIERLHRQFLEVVKVELDRLGIEDINNVQALILSHIGEEELTVGELSYRGYYQGSNVSYNVKKMIENGYLKQERSAHDRSTVRVSVSDKGLEICDLISVLYDRRIGQLADESIGEDAINSTTEALL
jgi:DNA-binding MarR family transcriptional regulator